MPYMATMLPIGLRIREHQSVCSLCTYRNNVHCRTYWYTESVFIGAFTIRRWEPQCEKTYHLACVPNENSAAQSDQSSVPVWEKFASSAIQSTSSEDSDLTPQKRRLIWILAGRTCPKVCFLTHWIMVWGQFSYVIHQMPRCKDAYISFILNRGLVFAQFLCDMVGQIMQISVEPSCYSRKCSSVWGDQLYILGEICYLSVAVKSFEQFFMTLLVCGRVLRDSTCGLLLLCLSGFRLALIFLWTVSVLINWPIASCTPDKDFWVFPLDRKSYPTQGTIPTVLSTSLGKTFFAWRFILNENILFWLTISYQKPFVFYVSVFCSQIFTQKLKLRPKIGLT